MGSDADPGKADRAAKENKVPIVPLVNFGGVLIPSALLISAAPERPVQPLWPTYELAQAGTPTGSPPTSIPTSSKALVLGSYGEPALFCGREMPLMTDAEHDVVQALHTQWPKRVRMRDLDKLSGHGHARQRLYGLVKREPLWRSIISFPDKSKGWAGRGYSLNLR